MSPTSPSGVTRAHRPLRAARSLPAILERMDQLEAELRDANRRIDELQASVAAIGAVRDEVRDLTEQVTEQLNDLSASLATR
jgi:small-conductance mechanosensitive channel